MNRGEAHIAEIFSKKFWSRENVDAGLGKSDFSPAWKKCGKKNLSFLSRIKNFGFFPAFDFWINIGLGKFVLSVHAKTVFRKVRLGIVSEATSIDNLSNWY